MKQLYTILLLCFFCPAFSQWTREQQLPASNIFSLFHDDKMFFAGGTNVVYTSTDKGATWIPTSPLPGLSPATSIIDHIIYYKDELYISSPRKDGVFKSVDRGHSWLNISKGLDTLTRVMGFCSFKDELYIATSGSFAQPVYKLNAGRTQWTSFNDGLTGISSNLNCIAATSTTLLTGANANGLFDYLAPNTTAWEERFLLNQISPTEAAFDIIPTHDSLFMPGKSGKFYMSTDRGLNWNLFATRLPTGNTTMVNAQQALIVSRYIFDGVQNITLFYSIKKDSLQAPMQNFSVIMNHFTWRMAIVDGKLWDASDGGLFFMDLSNLPGITEAADSVNVTILPIRFVSVNADCSGSQVVVRWKTELEQNNTRFGIERSPDSIHWSEIGSASGTGTGQGETNYNFMDAIPLANGYYRIAEHDINGAVRYSKLVRAECMATNTVKVWPNPMQRQLFVRILSAASSPVFIRLYDIKGTRVLMKTVPLVTGENIISMDIQHLAAGTYSVSVTTTHGLQKSIQVVKQ